ncbi:class I SAM-dependent methyltransferase [Fredinandcohnia sp. 179-A 10B2 NHS]|uniref:class I SAM-dependent methyltransferase n=1 Tax=Fredinandcohnia sp. 179-A 10B2 NHS TaxID=3235176 RepID=UPI0039A3ECC4
MINILRDIITNSKDNEISFEDYMSIVLYHPEKGYYMKKAEKIGRSGDFITTSNISTIFGILFARVFHMLITKEKVSPYICEIGGGNGRFAKAVLDELSENYNETYEKLTYLIIETSPYHQSLQNETLPIGEKIVQYESIEEAARVYPAFNGIVFSNELFDAFPVRVIEKRDDQLFEVKVAIEDDNKLGERLSKLTDEKILRYLSENEIALVNGQRFEVPLAMLQYLEQLSRFINSAVVFTVDYGYTNQEWMQPAHKDGSLRGYYKHQLIRDPLLHPGEMDLTTHIHFDSLVSYGDKLGIKQVRKMRQDEFLLAAGILSFLEQNYDPDPFSEKSKRNRAIRSLIMDGSMSSMFHVFIQEKNYQVEWDSILIK